MRASSLRRALFGTLGREATFARRGFVGGDAEIVAHLEAVGFAFLAGYNEAIKLGCVDGLLASLRNVPPSHRGFAMEGASMAFVMLDRLLRPRRDRFRLFLTSAAVDHLYMAHVGAGWALARLRIARFAWTRRRTLAAMDPLLGWLAIDGYGFHEGYFHPRRAVKRQRQPAPTNSYVCRAFDQGLGRSLWFSECADPWRIRAAILRFPEYRRSDLWSGVGLACTYAGGVSDAAIAAVKHFGAAYGPQIAQGAAFAAKTRLRAGNLVDHTVRACRILCDSEVAEAAAVTDRCLADLPAASLVPAYEIWRQRIAAYFVRQPHAAQTVLPV
jgi:hypothetical protein